jgi:hypothetical protein
MGLLYFLQVVIIVASNSVFSPKENFVVNSKDNTKVKIAQINENFFDGFLGFYEGPEEKHFLRAYSSGESLHYVDIIDEFNGLDIESSLFDIWTLLSLQPQGEKGDLSLLAENVFYVKDVEEKTQAVLVRWSIFGWNIRSFSLDRGERLEKGSQIFIRKR